MKYLFKLLISMCMVLCVSCGTGDAEYSADYDKVLKDIVDMELHAEGAASTVISVWETVGNDDLFQVLTGMLTVKSLEELIEGYYDYKINEYGPALGFKEFPEWEDMMDGGGFAKVYEVCLTLQDDFGKAQVLNEQIPNEISTLKEKYESKHSNAIAALSSYYVTASTLTDTVISPSGTLESYSSTIASYVSELSALKKTAEVSK